MALWAVVRFKPLLVLLLLLSLAVVQQCTAASPPAITPMNRRPSSSSSLTRHLDTSIGHRLKGPPLLASSMETTVASMVAATPSSTEHIPVIPAKFTDPGLEVQQVKQSGTESTESHKSKTDTMESQASSDIRKLEATMSSEPVSSTSEASVTNQSPSSSSLSLPTETSTLVTSPSPSTPVTTGTGSTSTPDPASSPSVESPEEEETRGPESAPAISDPATSSPSPQPDPQSQAWIAGPVLGGLVGLSGLATLIYWQTRKRRAAARNSHHHRPAIITELEDNRHHTRAHERDSLTTHKPDSPTLQHHHHYVGPKTTTCTCPQGHDCQPFLPPVMTTTPIELPAENVPLPLSTVDSHTSGSWSAGGFPSSSNGRVTWRDSNHTTGSSLRQLSSTQYNPARNSRLSKVTVAALPSAQEVSPVTPGGLTPTSPAASNNASGRRFGSGIGAGRGGAAVNEMMGTMVEEEVSPVSPSGMTNMSPSTPGGFGGLSPTTCSMLTGERMDCVGGGVGGGRGLSPPPPSHDPVPATPSGEKLLVGFGEGGEKS